MTGEQFVFIFVGRSGSGKGTQLELLAKYIEQKYPKDQYKLNMGALYRALFESQTHISEIAKDITMHQGKFQPDFLTNALFVEDAVRQLKKDQHIFLDGYPRSISQLETVAELLSYAGFSNPVIIDIEVTAEEVKKRMLLRGRGDDSGEKIESRLLEYERMVVPMIEHIKMKSNLTYIKIDGMPTPAQIHEDIKKKLGI